MSALPSRTRSPRKPAEAKTGTEAGYPLSHTSATMPKAERSSQSPSRLPVKPSKRISTTIPKPPSSAEDGAGDGSIYPPPPRANVGAKTLSGGLQRSTSNRRSNTISITEPEPVKKDRSRPPITTSRHVRNTSTASLSAPPAGMSQAHKRASSTQLITPSLRPPTRGSIDEPRPRDPHIESQLRKPAFSTLQQHFSPAKSLAPKPHLAAFLAPSSPSKLPSNIAISAETSKLQNELLQLHLLHKDAICVGRDWRRSAKDTLRSRFNAIVEHNNQLVQLEVEEAGRINAATLKIWQDLGVPGWGLEEKIQVLDEIVSGVWNLTEAGGKYAKTVRSFERWARRCQDILLRRKHGDGLEEDSVMFVEELDAGWKDDCLFLGRKLSTWSGQLANLGTLDYGSSLGGVFNGIGELLKGMLQEVSLMASIEQDAMAMELDWIRSMNDDLDEDKDTPTAGAIWRSR